MSIDWLHGQDAGLDEAPLFAGIKGPEGQSGESSILHSMVDGLSTCIIDPLADLITLFERAENPENVAELLDLAIGRAEIAASGTKLAQGASDIWRTSKPRRSLTTDHIANAPVTPSFFKGMFDFFFRRDLYGHWISRQPIILSSGSFDESVFGLPDSLKDCVRFALSRNWHGYSDSRGRIQTREAIADLEQALTNDAYAINSTQIAITLGGTAAIASIADLIANGRPKSSLRAICGLPNYPPLVAAVSRFFNTELIATPLVGGSTNIDALIERARSNADLVLLQTVTNPWGTAVKAEDIDRLLKVISPHCVVVLDACHEWFGPQRVSVGTSTSTSKLPDNVVIVRSISKRWAAPGIKCGWIVGSAEFIDEFYVHASTTYGGPPSLFFLLLEVFARFETLYCRGKTIENQTIAQFELNYLLTADTLRNAYDDYHAASNRFTENVLKGRLLTADILSRSGFEVVKPSHSINVFVRAQPLPDYAVYRNLIQSENVSVFPTTLCMLPCSGGIRVSPCVPHPVLIEALERLVNWRERTIGDDSAKELV